MIKTGQTYKGDISKLPPSATEDFRLREAHYETITDMSQFTEYVNGDGTPRYTRDVI